MKRPEWPRFWIAVVVCVLFLKSQISRAKRHWVPQHIGVVIEPYHMDVETAKDAAFCAPNVLHFTKTDGDENPFDYGHFLAVYSAQKRFGVDEIILHADVEPSSFWWSLAKRTGPSPVRLNTDLGECLLNVTKKGVIIEKVQHKSDFLRFCLLEKYGGIYSDLDSFAIRPVHPALLCSGYDVVLGVQKNTKRQAAIGMMIMRSGTRFLEAYRKRSEEVFDGTKWDAHTVRLVTEMSGEDPLALLVDVQNFYPLFDRVELMAGKKALPKPGSKRAFEMSGEVQGWDTSYAFHMFNSHKNVKKLAQRQRSPCWLFGVMYNALNANTSKVKPRWQFESIVDLNIISPMQLVYAELTCQALEDNLIPSYLIAECPEERDLICSQPSSFFQPDL